MTSNALQRWVWVHRWSSLVCTLFLMILCLTGLPLIFKDEINKMTGAGLMPPDPVPAGSVKVDLDVAARIIKSRHPEHDLLDICWVEQDPGTVWFNMGAGGAARGYLYRTDEYRMNELPANYMGHGTFMGWLLRLHTDLLLGLPGRLFLVAVALSFVVALASGVVLYAPFARKLRFGELRRGSRRTRWLDIHNLLGVIALMWTLVVGTTGAVNAVHDQMIDLWRAHQLAELAKPYAGQPPARNHASLQQALETAMRAAPQTSAQFLSLPGSVYSTPHHFTLWMQGTTPATSRLRQVVMIDAATGQLTEQRKLPWYMTLMFVAEPLHFGDYAGLPLKILWALFTLITIVVLTSGIYLWAAKPFRRNTRQRTRAKEIFE